jgi:hypothetical protein
MRLSATVPLHLRYGDRDANFLIIHQMNKKKCLGFYNVALLTKSCLGKIQFPVTIEYHYHKIQN